MFSVCVKPAQSWRVLIISYPNVVKYRSDRDRLEWTVEGILFREGCYDITCNDLSLLGGKYVNISSKCLPPFHQGLFWSREYPINSFG